MTEATSTMPADDTISLAQALIRQPSVSPVDGDCQKMMADYLSMHGFQIEHLPFGPVSNLWATRSGNLPGPLFVFAGHTDVVPTGPEDQWDIAPFSGELKGDILHGRGAADMKGSLAAMMTASARFVSSNAANYRGTIGFLITSDEEDLAIDGTVKVMDTLEQRGVKPDFCLVGEPSSSTQLGDVIRIGRRGSLSARLTINGVQGHVAYPDDADNPIHRAGAVINALTNIVWDTGNEYFPGTTFQISNLNAGTGAGNVIPGSLTMDFNFRFSTESTQASLRQQTESIIAKYCDNFDIEWRLSGDPFLTTGGNLIPAVQQAIRTHLDIETELSTSGGTSDGRFIAPRGIEVVEFGPCNATIHKLNEHISASSLVALSTVYEAVLQNLLLDTGSAT